MKGVGIMAKRTERKEQNKPLQKSITKNGKRYSVGISQDKNGFYAHTHRARSKFIESTG